MDFDKRLTKAKIVEKLFIQWCNIHDVSWAYTGIEKLKREHPEFREDLMKLNSESALTMRFFPDMMVCKEEAWEVDLKWGNFIEKNAYESYCRLSLSGLSIAIVNLRMEKKELIFIDLEKLKFKDISNYSLPNDGRWLYPRDLPEDEYIKWKKHTGGSGTPFGIIDYRKTEYITLWADIKNI